MLVCFNKVAGIRFCNFVKKGFQHRGYFVKLFYSVKCDISKNTFEVTAFVGSENLGKILVHNN